MNKLNKTILWLVAIIIIAGLIWLGYSEKEPVVEGEVIKIGAVLPLSGDMASYGNDELNAINLFIKENKLEDKVELIVEDSQSNPTQAVSALNNVLIKEVDIILTIGSSISLAMQPISNQNEIPVISVGANPNIANGYMIQNLPTSKDYVEKVVEEIENRNVNKLGIIYKNDELGVSVKDNLLEMFSGESFLESFNQDETDFRTIITKIKSKNPDALFVVNTETSLGILIKQIREQMDDIQIYSVPEIATENVKKVAGESYKKIIHSDLVKDPDNLIYKEFEDNYMKEYGADKISFDSILAYNEMILINECLDEKEDLFNCLLNIEKEGLNGKLRIEDNRIKYEMMIKEIQ